MNKALILVVEDDRPIRNLIVTTLKTHDYKYITAENGSSAILEASSHKPEIILLDLGLPDMEGVDVIKKVRTWSNVPIIVISARSEDVDKIEALDAGADDYITKPFGVMELISRVKALLRRTSRMNEDSQLIHEDILMDMDKHAVTVAGQLCELTFKEFELLKYLMLNQGIVLSRDKIMDQVWGFEYEGESRTVDMHITTLRQKLGAAGSCIKTVRNVGYMIE